jgi:hypothetical protein
MISLIIFVIALLVSVGWAVATRTSMTVTTETDRFGRGGTTLNAKWLFMPIGILVIGLLASLIQPFALDRIDQGNIGLKVNLTGDDRGISDYKYKTGWVVYNTWTENLYQFPTFQQHIEYDSVNVITKGGFSAIIKPTFNYNLIATEVGSMFQELRVDVKQMEQGWLKTAIIGSVNDVANKWAVDDIFNNREQFESAIILECNKRVSKWFIVSQLRTNIVPPASLQVAILEKTNAIQKAQAEMQKALVADAQAQVKIANAKGDSAQVVIKASGDAYAMVLLAKAEADAMKLKQKELNAIYVEYIKASNWNGVLPTTTLGNSTPMLTIK